MKKKIIGYDADNVFLRNIEFLVEPDAIVPIRPAPSLEVNKIVLPIENGYQVIDIRKPDRLIVLREVNINA